MNFFQVLVLGLGWPVLAIAGFENEQYFHNASVEMQVPVDVLKAVSRVESKGMPYLLNVGDKRFLCDTKTEALIIAKKAAAEGKSFDVGLMQVNNKWLTRHKIPLEAALDPAANVLLGAHLLRAALSKAGWKVWDGVADYQSEVSRRPEEYVAQVRRALYLMDGSVDNPARPYNTEWWHDALAVENAQRTDDLDYAETARPRQADETMVAEATDDAGYKPETAALDQQAEAARQRARRGMTAQARNVYDRYGGNRSYGTRTSSGNRSYAGIRSGGYGYGYGKRSSKGGGRWTTAAYQQTPKGGKAKATAAMWSAPARRTVGTPGGTPTAAPDRISEATARVQAPMIVYRGAVERQQKPAKAKSSPARKPFSSGARQVEIAKADGFVQRR